MNAKEMTMKRSTIAKTFAIAAITALALGMAPTAKADNYKGCSNASLKGTFSHMATGFSTAPPAMAGPLAGVGTDTFDGNGNIKGTATLSVNGNIVSVSETGTYKVNDDCTGTYTVQFSGGGGTSASFVITSSWNEIQAICTDSGTVLSHIFRRQFPVGDWRD
jgi:hypothetical protein